MIFRPGCGIAGCRVVVIDECLSSKGVRPGVVHIRLYLLRAVGKHSIVPCSFARFVISFGYTLSAEVYQAFQCRAKVLCNPPVACHTSVHRVNATTHQPSSAETIRPRPTLFRAPRQTTNNYYFY